MWVKGDGMGKDLDRVMSEMAEWAEDMTHHLIWLNRASDGKTHTVKVGDRLAFELEESPYSGYTWRFLALPEGLNLLTDSFTDPWSSAGIQSENKSDPGRDSKMRYMVLGVEGRRKEFGGEIRLVKDRQWESVDPVDSMSVMIKVKPKPQVDKAEGRVV
jgi:hypothetical protein